MAQVKGAQATKAACAQRAHTHSVYIHGASVLMLNCLLGYGPQAAQAAAQIAATLQQGRNSWLYLGGYAAQAYPLAQWARHNGMFNMFK